MTQWPFARLDEVAEVRLGRQRSPKNHSGRHMRPYLRAANVGWTGLRLDDVKEMNFTDAELAVYRLEPGDLLLNEASGSPGEVGKPALWSGEIEDCAFQNTLLRVRPREHEPKFLMHFFRSIALSGKFVRESRGVGINHLVRAAITGAQVSGPRNPAQLHDAGTADGDLPPLPVGWEWRRLEEVADVVGGVTKDAKKQSDPSYVEVPYLRVANVQRGRLNLDVVTRIRVPAVKAQALALRAGDILLNEGGDRDKLAGGGSGRSKFQTASIRTMFLALDRGSE